MTRKPSNTAPINAIEPLPELIFGFMMPGTLSGAASGSHFLPNLLMQQNFISMVHKLCAN
jgi:hypothetical protein